MGRGRVLSIDFFRLSPQCGGCAGDVMSLTLQWTKNGTRTISLSRKSKFDGRKVRLRNSPRMCGGEVTNDWCIFFFLARSSHASNSQFERQRQIIIALSLETIEIPIQTETSYTHSSWLREFVLFKWRNKRVS